MDKNNVNEIIDAVGTQSLAVSEMEKPQSLTGKKIVNIVSITPEHIKKAEEIANAFDFSNTNAIMTFGAAAQSRYVQSLKALIGGAQVKDLKQAGDVTLKITKGIEMLNLDGMKKQTSPGTWVHFSSQLPVVGRFFSYIHRFAARQQELVDLIASIEKGTEDDMVIITKDNARVDVMKKEIGENFYTLAVTIYAGELAIERGLTEYDNFRIKAIQSGDAMDIANVNNFREQIVSFDTRLLRIKTAYARAPITMQKLLTTQQSGRIELQNLIESLLFDLPQFMEIVVQLLSLYNIQSAQQNRLRRTELTQRLSELEGTLLEEVAIAAKEGQVTGAKEVKLLEIQANKIIETTKKLVSIDQQNAKTRVESENLLVEVLENFKDALKEATQPTPIN